MSAETRPLPEASFRKWLLAALLLALLFQVILVVRSPAVARDSITFISVAKRLVGEPVETMRRADQHPGFPAMILAGRWLVSPLVPPDSVFSWVWGARLVSGIFGLLVLIAVWLLAKHTFDERIAAITAIGVAVLPEFRQNAADALSDMPHLFFYLLAVWVVSQGMIRRRWGWFLVAGALSGLAYWIRPEGLSVAIVTVVVLPLWAWRWRTMKPRKVLLSVGAVLLATLLVSLPYWILAGKISSKIASKAGLGASREKGVRTLLPVGPKGASHKRVLTPFSPSLPEGSVPGADADTASAPVPPADGQPGDDADDFWEAAGAAVVEMMRKSAQSVRWVLILPFAVGVFAVRRPRTDQVPRILIVALIAFHVLLLVWLYHVGGYISHRHLMPGILLVTPWIASGGLLIAEKICSLLPERKGVGADRRRGVVLVVLLAALAAALSPRTLRPLHAREIPAMEVALWLAGRAQPGDTVLSNSPYVPFFSELPGRFVTRREGMAGIDLSKIAPPCRYVVLDKGIRGYRPEWPTQLGDRYEPVTVPGVRGGDVRTFILRSKPPAGP